MDFERKIKIRKNVAIAYIAIGLVLIGINVFVQNVNDFISSFGLMIFVIGIARIVQIKRITKNEESINKRRIAETDERNVMLWTKARGLAAVVFTMVAACAIVILELINMHEYATIVSCCVFAYVIIYWICYFIVYKRY